MSCGSRQDMHVVTVSDRTCLGQTTLEWGYQWTDAGVSLDGYLLKWDRWFVGHALGRIVVVFLW
jgi:hypothetical protein